MAQPNILFILADDLGWGDVSYHRPNVRTPTIDRLVYHGVELDYHYVCPVCTPTRTSLMTGKHPGRFGKFATTPTNQPVLPDGYTTIATMLHGAGYATGIFGKWHLGSTPDVQPGAFGFDYSYGSLAGGVDPYTHRYKTGTFSSTWHRNGELVEEQGHASDLIVDEAIDWIEAQQGLWFCYVPFTAVHTPVRAPESWVDMYWYEEFDSDPTRNYSQKVYAAYTSHMDHNVGRLVESLKCLDQIHNTVIVFASDNGGVTTNPSSDVALYPGYHEDMPRTGCNLPLRGHKAQLYEGGIRTPCVVSWEGTLAPHKLEIPVQVTDWMPTFAALVGSDYNDTEWDGRNMWPQISGEVDEEPDRVLYWNLRHNRFAVRHRGWKLIATQRDWGEELELFHIAVDPLEERECSARHPERTAELLQLIRDQHARDDSCIRPCVDSDAGLKTS